MLGGNLRLMNEKKFQKVEEERTNALEMAAQANEEREAKATQEVI